MDISNVSSTTQASSGTPTGGSVGTLDENDFLKLLTAQLQAQDPLNPMDATNFASQLAQFSSVEQLTNINSQLSAMTASQAAMQNTMATELIGKTVSVTGNTVTLNGTANLNYSLQSNASNVTLSVYDSSGALVKTAVVGSESAGNNSFAWDGTDNKGNQLPSGQCTFTVAAVDGTGQSITATPLTSGTVTGVSFNNNVTYLSINGTTQVQLGDIHEISGGI